MTSKKKLKPQDIKKKIHQIYDNYGMDCVDIEEDEMERLIQLYSESGDIEADLDASKKIKEILKTEDKEE